MHTHGTMTMDGIRGSVRERETEKNMWKIFKNLNPKRVDTITGTIRCSYFRDTTN